MVSITLLMTLSLIESLLKGRFPIVELILNAIKELSQLEGRRAALLGICPVSYSVIRTSIEYAKFFNFPLMFVVTLNQVGIDGGYTGLTPAEFVELVKRKCERADFGGR